MNLWHKALTLAVLSEVVTISLFVMSLREGFSRKVALILHAPAVFLIRAHVPWLAALLIEGAVLMLIWFLVLRLFARPKDEPGLSQAQDEWGQTKAKPIEPR